MVVICFAASLGQSAVVEDLASGLAGLEVEVALAALCEGKDLVDGHAHLALRHPVEHLARAPQQLLARRGVV